MERSPEIEDLVRTWFMAASGGDASLVDRLVDDSEHARLIGSDPDEVLRGGSEIRDFLRGEVEGAAGNLSFVPSDVEAFTDGNVGWATTNLTITIPDGGQVRPRWSAVFHRRGDDWRFVQTHASIGVPNADVGWTYPS